MHHPTLWRINGASPDLALADPEALPTGLRRHLRTAWLTICLVQIHTRQQVYVALAGCPGCAHDRCEAGCRVEALRRTLRAAAHPLSLGPVRRGLAERPYTRRAVAIPTRRARPLDPTMLQPWAEARLTVTLRPGPRGRLLAGATLHVGTDGPDPAAVLRQLGWRAWRGWRTDAAGLPSAPQLRVWAYPGAPWMPLPCVVAPATPGPQEQAAAHEQPAANAAWGPADTADPGVLAEHARLAERLGRILRGETVLTSPLARSPAASAGAAPAEAGRMEPAQPGGGWPDGPGAGNGAISPAVLEALIARLLDESGPERADSGLTLRRMNLLLGDRHNEHSRAVLLWLEAAGLLATPADPDQPWAAPRALEVRDPAVIAARLRSAALPDAAAVERAKRTMKK